ncbi:tRNA glutamyl-Q(34) synthetase GluQRS [Aliamphritea spongicola]|uniref:tRNA glutamyl-Q(34) synthetase GluQRS n=1 Tax=Aliamphritea spongicola TaxID=707589 RepID=UPI00196A8DB9|nr:tRNA glutamyl-Q(34) synthetase GluQRS [Aliamphritea spongicola]MBN3564168.1 tRNA glutamyl-Q(34) synthetase GluQRS [Aliamphritea spongicola]
MTYTGRFAPSPTGPLHFGSLLAALASYLDARHHNGQWLVRIEDLDPPREAAGASDAILRCLENFGFEWDGEVIYQSQRHEYYREHLQLLIAGQNAYYCNCSRQQLRQRSGSHLYDGYCLTHPPAGSEGCAIRCRVPATANPENATFSDRIQGLQLAYCSEDFVLFRRDGFFAYQLAVVLDDAVQKITHVVRGSDLLDSTPKQLQLQQRLNLPDLSYAHIPVAANDQGQKLSKQTFARALDDEPVPQLLAALEFLGQQPPATLSGCNKEDILAWAIQHWQINNVPAQASIIWQPAP